MSSSDGFVTVAKRSKLQDPSKQTFEVDGQWVVLVCLDGQVYCLDDVCTHDGGTLGDGELDHGCLVCPRHGAKFDVKTGDAVAMPATEPTLVHEVRVVEDDVQVRLRSA